MDLIELGPGELVAPEVARALIMRFQNGMAELPGVFGAEGRPLVHKFAPGVYCREVHLLAGDQVVGRIHKHAHLNFINKGSVTVFTEFGTDEHKAGDSFVSQAGAKRVVLAHEDTVWTTVHPNPDNCTDVQQLVERYTAETYAELGMAVADLEQLT
jgi:hypothetical protein